jgi:hypothetical protein
MYVNGKKRPVETIPGMVVEGEIKENDEGVNLSMIYLIYCNNFCKYHNVQCTPSQHNNKNKN